MGPGPRPHGGLDPGLPRHRRNGYCGRRSLRGAMVIRESTQHLQRWITGLASLVAALGVLVAGAGILTAWGHTHRAFVTLRGETVPIQGGGLYAHESVSMAAQAIGQDVVTLLVAVPLLLLAIRLASTGSVRGVLLRTGALAHFAYTYLLMAFCGTYTALFLVSGALCFFAYSYLLWAFGGTYNALFLVYVALFSAAAFGLILSLVSIDPSRV